MKNDKEEALEKTHGNRSLRQMVTGPRRKLDSESVRAGTTGMRKWGLFPHAYPRVENLT